MKLDKWTYQYAKKLACRISKPYTLPEEVKEIVEWCERSGFVLQYVISPQTKAFSDEIMPGSYNIELYYDLGEERLQILLLNILKNEYTGWQPEWRLRLDEVKNNDMETGTDFEELKEKVGRYLLR